MATRTATRRTAEKVEETKSSSDANTEDTIVQVREPEGDWRDLTRATRREALAAIERRSVPGLAFPTAAEFRAVDWITREEVAEPRPKPRTRKAAAPKDTGATSARRNRFITSKGDVKVMPAADLPDGWDWKDPKLPGRILRLKGQGKTIKEITAELGLPAREGVWHKVSLIYRAAADAKGIDRPRRPKEAK